MSDALFFRTARSARLILKIRTDSTEGYVQCEKLALLDLNVREFLKIDRISVADIINITDVIQGIFDYV